MTAAEADTIYRIGNVSLDVDRRVLTGPRGQIMLAPIPFALMERLMRRPGVVQSVGALTSAIWPEPDDEPADPYATIREKLSKLRGALCMLGTDGRGKVEIANEVGVGYFVRVRAQ